MNDKNYNPSSINEYFAWLERTVSPDTALYQSAHAYMEQTRKSFANPEKHDGPLTVTDLVIRIVGENDASVDYTANNVKINGEMIEDRLVFLKNDPQIHLNLPEPMKISRILIGFTLQQKLSDEDIEIFLKRHKHKDGSIFYRGARKLYRMIKKIFKK
ncbi:MAG: hypothetical protein IKB75_06625 [Clostridia bacterium]|nr:hypothetical protein [Clostridia bacterium]